MTNAKDFPKTDTTVNNVDAEKVVAEAAFDAEAAKIERKIFWQADWRLIPILGES